MSQSRTLSLVEAVANVAVGYGLAVAAQLLVFPVMGLSVTVQQTLTIGLLFTGLSIARSYLLSAALRSAGATDAPRRCLSHAAPAGHADGGPGGGGGNAAPPS